MEMYKQIENSNFAVSNLGNIKNLNSNNVYRPILGNSGYLQVCITINNKKTSIMIHRYVAKYFIENPHNKPQVNHINGIKTDNRIENLEWVTPKENMKHAFELGLYKKYNNQTYKGKFGEEHNRSVKLICNGILYNGYSEASRKTGIKVSTIHRAVKEKRPCFGMHFELETL